MQLVTAIIQPFMVDRLTRALRKANVPGYTVIDVEGSVNVADEPVSAMPRVRVDVAVNDARADEVMEIMANTVRTHQKGDGIVYAIPISRFVHIETGKADTKALE
ncbi:MAG: P-II family nitrogen regulator [Candidatus Obscuribacter phosphatis]|uniref:P-II family nitrogen regulator n=1 Tax=Candidatus Obscuribacter phosphatis TaxID=1906157 RepID=A0A8J7PMP9_9BACT|nr:P-II family nitrogen regulator [Candidatus Obscuribacter phosphatis]